MTNTDPRALARAMDPSTPPDELAEYAEFGDYQLQQAARQNPNLPSELLLQWLGFASPDAWRNPAAPLLLLERSGDDKMRQGALILLRAHPPSDTFPSVAVMVLDASWQSERTLWEALGTLDMVLETAAADSPRHKKGVEVGLFVATHAVPQTGAAREEADFVIGQVQLWLRGGRIARHPLKDKALVMANKAHLFWQEHPGDKAAYAAKAATLAVRYLVEAVLNPAGTYLEPIGTNVAAALGNLEPPQDEAPVLAALRRAYPTFPLTDFSPGEREESEP